MSTHPVSLGSLITLNYLSLPSPAKEQKILRLYGILHGLIIIQIILQKSFMESTTIV